MRVLFFLGLLFAWLVPSSSSAGIRDTKHNLSAYGPGTIRAEEETRICIFCHTPHHASQTAGVLWNRDDPTVTYIPYQSSTLRATVGQPTGASKLCLSCHDGTIALGELLSEPDEVGFVGGVRFLPPGASLIGTDLSNDHPISFHYDLSLVAENPELADPLTLTGSVRLDAFGQLQCTSCHDPHDEAFGKFLVAPLQGSALCTTCHQQSGWSSSAHATSLARWNGSPPDPWPHTNLTTVAENACANCHRSHGAASTSWILNRVTEEDNCLVCHNGGTAFTDIQADISLPFHHPVELTTDVHSSDEDPTFPMTKHVECTDCHNPHVAKDKPAFPPLASGSLAGVSGVDSQGQKVESVDYEYEVCFKCHAVASMSSPSINRQLLENDKRLQFQINNPSYHPVEGPGVNLNVPSLLPPMTEASIIYCGDCHASDSGPGAGGSGARGSHGSVYPHLLERQYNTVDGIAYDTTLYDLCYKCHSEASILRGDSFKEHAEHLEEGTSCSTCHDPHGISSNQGNALNNSHLINFDLTVVSPDPGSGRLEFEDTGQFSGRCYLQCHGEAHSPEQYER